jgi:hypothetical protein
MGFGLACQVHKCSGAFDLIRTIINGFHLIRRRKAVALWDCWGDKPGGLVQCRLFWLQIMVSLGIGLLPHIRPQRSMEATVGPCMICPAGKADPKDTH